MVAFFVRAADDVSNSRPGKPARGEKFIFCALSWYFVCSLLHGKEQKIAYFIIFVAYFTLLLTKKQRTKYQEAAQNPKYFRFCSKIIQTLARHVLDLSGYSGASPAIFLRFFVKSHFRKSFENSRCFKSSRKYTEMEKI